MTKLRPGRMAKSGKRSVDKTDAELVDQDLQILLQTKIDWETLQPQISSSEKMNELIKVIEEATSKNEGIAELHARIKQLGSEGINLAKKVVKLIT